MTQDEFGHQVSPHDRDFANALFRMKGSLANKVLHAGLQDLIQDIVYDADLLEAGCGPGIFTSKLIKHCPRTLLAVDINKALLEKAERRFAPDIPLDFAHHDLTSPLDSFSRTFDGVICASVLMHLEPEDSFLAIQHMGAVVRNHGWIALAVINRKWARSVYFPDVLSRGTARLIPTGEDSYFREWYPRDAHYCQALFEAGFSIRTHHLRIPPHAKALGSPYAQNLGKALWTVFIGRKTRETTH